MSLIVIYKSKNFDYVCSDSSINDESISSNNLRLNSITNKLIKINETTFLGFTGSITNKDKIETIVLSIINKNKSIFKNKSKLEEQIKILKNEFLYSVEDEDLSDVTIILYLNGNVLLLDNGSVLILEEDVACFGYTSDFAKGYLTNINIKEKQEKVVDVEKEIITLYEYLKENSNYILDPFIVYKVKK